MPNQDHLQKDILSDRKADHIDLTFKSQVSNQDERFYYEPMLNGHPTENETYPVNIIHKQLNFPIWVSSMTGGTQHAKNINQRLAKACGEFGLGMGLGSCRQLLHDDTHLEDFAVRKYIGNQYPLFANLGIAQVEEIISEGNYYKLTDLIAKLQADGLIIHINPMQEFMQPEGDRIKYSPIETVKRVLDKIKFPIIIKEVGQGFGPKSLAELMKLPLAAIEFGAAGGTNFSKLEMMRGDNTHNSFGGFTKIGHTAGEMVDFINKIIQNKNYICKDFIVSGGIKDFLDGYYHINKLSANAIYGQASGFLKPALVSYELLQQHIQTQTKGLVMAKSCLDIKH